MSYLKIKNQYITINDTKIAYREVGKGNSDIPLIMLVHLAATMDNWDPKLIDLLSEKQHLILIDLPGVGSSEGVVPTSIPKMAKQAISIINELGFFQINLLGLSMGGMIAQEIVRMNSELVKKLILVGTAYRGGEGVDKVTYTTFKYMFKAFLNKTNVKRYIFYNHDNNGEVEANIVLSRLDNREKEYKDKEISVKSFLNQLKAIKKWGTSLNDDLSFIKQPTLIVNGDKDMMIPTKNSYIMHDRISGSKLIIYSNSGHGSIFQYADDFASKLIEFLYLEK